MGSIDIIKPLLSTDALSINPSYIDNKLLGKPGFEPGAARFGSAKSIHCAMPSLWGHYLWIMILVQKLELFFQTPSTASFVRRASSGRRWPSAPRSPASSRTTTAGCSILFWTRWGLILMKRASLASIAQISNWILAPLFSFQSKSSLESSR